MTGALSDKTIRCLLWCKRLQQVDDLVLVSATSLRSCPAYLQPSSRVVTSSASPVQLFKLQTALRDANIAIYGGERSCKYLSLPKAPSPRHEYGTAALTLELVESMDDAIDHLHANGSGHTECIVTGGFNMHLPIQWGNAQCVSARHWSLDPRFKGADFTFFGNVFQGL